MSILIVDDNRVSCKIVDLNLRKHGYETLIAYSGKDALEALSSHDDIDLVVADVKMPEVDGLELLRRMRENQAWAGIPVIMCTVVAAMETVHQAAELGCRHYMLKPINAGQFIQKVRQILNEKDEMVRRDVSSDNHTSETSSAVDSVNASVST